MFGLAARLHMPASRVLSEVSGREFAQWMAFASISETDADPQAQKLREMGFQIE